jgi:large subunit ribosomal protein L31
MKPSIHPDYQAITVACSCGNTFQTRSTLGHDLQVEVCSNDHPFYTGKQKAANTGGNIARFHQRYSIHKGAGPSHGHPLRTNSAAARR